MGVSSTINRVALAGNGMSQSFPFPYYFFRQSDLLVYVYDTSAGGITGPLTLNSDYTVSGTPNAQGLYPNGANIVFSSYTPLTTDVVVIVRSPIEQQNYVLSLGQTLSSTAVVQQFDYLTLLVQRLEDQVDRCIQIPDGLGTAFSAVLPNNTALLPGYVPVVNPAGNGWLLAPVESALGGGTVTSVGLSLPAMFNVSNSPITTFGTIAASLTNQNANLVFAGPASGGAGAPTFRALVPADIPGVGLSPVNGGDTNLNILSSTTYVRSGTALTAPRLWTLPAAGTPGQSIYVKNLKSQSFNIILAANGSDTIEGQGNVTLNPGVGILCVVGAAGNWDVI